MKKPSDRIRDIYFSLRGRGADNYGVWTQAVMDYLDEVWEEEQGELKEQLETL